MQRNQEIQAFTFIKIFQGSRNLQKNLWEKVMQYQMQNKFGCLNN